MHKFIIQINCITCCLFLMNSLLTIRGTSNESCAFIMSCWVYWWNLKWGISSKVLVCILKRSESFQSESFRETLMNWIFFVEISLLKRLKLKQMVVHSKFSSLHLHQNKSCREYLRSRFASNKFFVFPVKLHHNRNEKFCGITPWETSNLKAKIMHCGLRCLLLKMYEFFPKPLKLFKGN